MGPVSDDPATWLHRVPTICDLIPRLGAQRLSRRPQWRLQEDDWRQIEFVSSDQIDVIEQEIEAVRRVRSASSEASGWRQVHVRSQPSHPLHHRLVPLEDLRTAIGGRGLLTRVGFVSTAGTIRDGFAIRAGSGLVIYGERSPSAVRIICLHGTDQVSADEVEGVATLMGQHQLLVVNWPRALVAQADPHALGRLLR
jgi:hypothetical protein